MVNDDTPHLLSPTVALFLWRRGIGRGAGSILQGAIMNIVDFFRWTADASQSRDPEWIVDAIRQGVVWFVQEGTARVEMRIRTRQKVLRVRRGAWVVLTGRGAILA